MGKNNRYSNEFKAQALKLSDEVGPKKAAAQLGMVRVWCMMLSDIPYGVAEQALFVHASRCVFAPAIADIRGIALELTNPGRTLTGEELWGKTLDAVRRYGRCNLKKAFGLIPEEAAPFVKRWFTDICDSRDPTFIKEPFIRSWEALRGRQRELALMPPGSVSSWHP